MRSRRNPWSGRWALALGLGFVLPGCSDSKPRESGPPPDRTLAVADSLVAWAVDAHLVPGAVLLVARSGKVVMERAYGSAQAMAWDGTGQGSQATPQPYRPRPEPLASPRPMTTGTVFDLASVTKVMATTMAIMTLVEDGKLGLDEPVVDRLPELSGTDKEPITVRHLLTHTGGLAQWQPLYYQAGTGQEALRVISGMPLAWPVGEDRHYSDLGFMVLGALVERVSGMALDRFVETEIYRPMGLSRTGFLPSEGPFAATSHGNPYEYRMVHDSTFGYRYRGDPDAWNGWRRYTLVGEVNDGNAFHAFGGVAGHAGLFSTAHELGRLVQLLLDQGRVEGVAGGIFAPETVRTFLTPAFPGQALGWRVPSWAPPGSFFHTGFTGTFVLGVPARGLAVVLLTNRQDFGVDEDTRYPDLGPLQRSVSEALLLGPPPGVNP